MKDPYEEININPSGVTTGEANIDNDPFNIAAVDVNPICSASQKLINGGCI